MQDSAGRESACNFDSFAHHRNDGSAFPARFTNIDQHLAAIAQLEREVRATDADDCSRYATSIGRQLRHYRIGDRASR
jgi:hypothetical protein